MRKNSKNIVLLGAGASFGHVAQAAERPPLANGFFPPLVTGDEQEIFGSLFDYLRTVVGIDTLATHDIEKVFEAVEPVWEMGLMKPNTPEGGGMRSPIFEPNGFGLLAYPNQLLKYFICRRIALSTQWLLNENCPSHQKLFSHCIGNGGLTVVSFNYDLIADKALQSLGALNTKRGYGVFDIAASESKDEYEYVECLKPHGSINWQAERPDTESYHIDIGTDDEKKRSKTSGNNGIRISEPDDALNGLLPYSEGKNAWLEVKAVAKQYDYIREHCKEELRDVLLDQILEDNLVKNYLPLHISPSPYKQFGDLSMKGLYRIWQRLIDAITKADRIITCGFSFRDPHFNQVLRHCVIQRSKVLTMIIITKDTALGESVKTEFTSANLEVFVYNGWMKDYTDQL